MLLQKTATHQVYELFLPPLQWLTSPLHFDLPFDLYLLRRINFMLTHLSFVFLQRRVPPSVNLNQLSLKHWILPYLRCCVDSQGNLKFWFRKYSNTCNRVLAGGGEQTEWSWCGQVGLLRKRQQSHWYWCQVWPPTHHEVCQGFAEGHEKWRTTHLLSRQGTIMYLIFTCTC